jgi:tetratricopeptide (TPR) repeat protein
MRRVVRATFPAEGDSDVCRSIPAPALCAVRFTRDRTRRAVVQFIKRTVTGPVETLVEVPAAKPGEMEQYVVEASASRPCEAGVRAFRDQQWEVAITAFQQALGEDPDDENAHFALGIAYEMTGQLDKALEQYESANRLPRRPNPAYSMSIERVRAKLGR